MFGRKAQVATEYLIITGFILVAVTIIFTYSYVTNNQSIKINQANNALDRIVNAADLVYALGPENVQYIWVSFPRDLENIQDISVCTDDGSQGHNIDCSSQGGVKTGAVEMELSLIGGVSKIARPAKTEIELDNETGECGDAWCCSGTQCCTGAGCCSGTSCLGYKAVPQDYIREGRQRLRIEWCDPGNSDKICVKRA